MKSFIAMCVCAVSLFTFETGLVGTWYVGGSDFKYEISFSEDGTYEVDLGQDGNSEVSGVYKLEGDQITLEDTGGKNPCVDPGIYTFEVKEDKITFTLKEDKCTGRSGLIAVTMDKKK